MLLDSSIAARSRSKENECNFKDVIHLFENYLHLNNVITIVFLLSNVSNHSLIRTKPKTDVSGTLYQKGIKKATEDFLYFMMFHIKGETNISNVAEIPAD